MEKSRKKFLKLPRLDGGKELLKQFLKENLQYPKEAVEKRIEGDVIIRFKVTGRGEVLDPKVEKGIGYGCDEEALRLVSMLQYQAVKNRGVRVTTNNKIKIPFRLRQASGKASLKMSYTGASKEKTAPKDQTPEKPSGKGRTYNYTINLGN